MSNKKRIKIKKEKYISKKKQQQILEKGNKDKNIIFRLSQLEKNNLEKICKNLRVTKSNFLRKTIADYKILLDK